MARKKQEPKNFPEILRRIHKAGLTNTTAVSGVKIIDPEMPGINERIELILKTFNQTGRKSTDMLFFVMYDIENNRIRNYIAKYLERMGCVRVQKSIFFASLERHKFEVIYQNLKEVQEVYENEDSIILVPVSTDEIRSMKVIGQNVDFDLMMGNKKTMFF